MKFKRIIFVLVAIFVSFCVGFLVSSTRHKQNDTVTSNNDALPRPIAVHAVTMDKSGVLETPRDVEAGDVRSGEDFLAQKHLGEEAVPKEEGNESPITSSEIDEESSRRVLSNPDLSPAVLAELRELFANGADGGIGEREYVQALSCYKKGAILSAAMSSMKYGNSREKENALWAVGMLFGNETATGVPFELSHSKEVLVGDDGLISDASTQTTANGSGGVASAGDANGGLQTSQGGEDGLESPHDMDSRDLITTVSAGLMDGDADVRETAFDVMSALPDEARGELAANLLSEGDVSLQEQLLSSAGESDSDADIRISLMGLGSEHESVRALAAANLKNVAGREFSDQHDAAQWFDAHSQQEFLQEAGNSNPETGKLQ